MLGFKSLETARKTISGIEIMHMVRKGQVDGIQCVLSEAEVLNKILGVLLDNCGESRVTLPD